MPETSFSFSGIGRNGADDIAYALFSFESIDKYESYRKDVKDDPECIEVTKQFSENPCFLSYERNFLKKMNSED